MLLTLNAFLIKCAHGIASEFYAAQCCDMGEKENPNLFSVGHHNFLWENMTMWVCLLLLFFFFCLLLWTRCQTVCWCGMVGLWDSWWWLNVNTVLNLTHNLLWFICCCAQLHPTHVSNRPFRPNRTVKWATAWIWIFISAAVLTWGSSENAQGSPVARGLIILTVMDRHRVADRIAITPQSRQLVCP